MTTRLRLSWPMATALLSVLFTLVVSPQASSVEAHGGGTPRLTSVPVGPYFVYAWSEPEPWRVGEVHLSIAVTAQNPDSSSNQVEVPVTDVEITVTYTPLVDNAVDATLAPVVVKAERQEFLSDFYFEADPTLTRVGDWQITVDVVGAAGSGTTQFNMETLPARTLNWTLIGSAGGVLLVAIALLAVWSRSQQPAQPAQRPHRGVRRPQGQQSRVAARKKA